MVTNSARAVGDRGRRRDRVGSQRRHAVVPAGNDLILATMTEQLGACGLCCISCSSRRSCSAGLRRGARAHRRARVAAGGVRSVLVQWIVIQAGVRPDAATGIAVPSQSAGRSSMVAFFVLCDRRAVLDRRASLRTPRARRVARRRARLRGRDGGDRRARDRDRHFAEDGRHETASRGIITRLADGVIESPEPAARRDRGAHPARTIADRHGSPLAISECAPVVSTGSAMGTLLGVHPTTVPTPRSSARSTTGCGYPSAPTGYRNSIRCGRRGVASRI
jgi:hypothetical protein